MSILPWRSSPSSAAKIALPDKDARAEAEPIDVTAGKRHGAVRQVSAPDTRRRDLAGDTNGEVAGTAAHVDDGDVEGPAFKDRYGSFSKKLCFFPWNQDVGRKFQFDTHEAVQCCGLVFGRSVGLIAVVLRHGHSSCRWKTL